MSGIREYKKEKLKRETKSKSDSNDEADDFGKRLRDHNLRRTIVIVALIIAAVVIIAILVIRIVANSYNGYTVEDYIRRTDSGYAVYMKNADGYVKFSKDGASAFTFEGKAKWNKTYEVSDMAVDQCGNYYAVANVGGNEIHVFNQDGFVSSINTALPIVKIEVSEQGLVVAILEDKEADYINMYNKDGSKIYTIKTTAVSDGIPVDLGVSKDGEKLGVSFTSIKGMDLSTSVDFYNFSVVGQNENERIVGGFNTYGNQLVGEVEFINNTAVVAVGENVISFFTVKEYPKHINNIEVTEQIDSIFYSDSRFAYVYTGENGHKNICVYTASGELIYTKEVSPDYSKYTFTESGLMAYGQNKFLLLNDKGNVLMEDEFEDDITQIINVGNNKEYIFVSPDKIYRVKLK